MKLSIRSVDITGILAGLETVAEHSSDVVRTMTYESAVAVRESAKAFVNDETGKLRNNLYVAYSPEESVEGVQTYAVSWRKKAAPHGHLLEFGHWQTHAAYKGKDGEWYSSKVALVNPKWIPAKPFLRPGYDSVAMQIPDIARAAGAKKYAELQRGDT
ncbi:capsid and scaffold [Xanthomonas phage vB_XooS_NR08]|nr:capsid and scaffold [Xanthomonas phage vB_XooS_NR08]